MDMKASRGAGDLDDSFDKDGKAFPLGSEETFGIASNVLTIQDGTLFIAGRLKNDYSIVSLNSDGSMNTDFNNTGVVQSVFKNGFFSQANDIKFTNNNELLISGLYYETQQGIYHHAFALYGKDGTINTDFGVSGKIIIPTRGNSTPIGSPKIIPLADRGTLVASTQRLPNGESIGMLYRLHKNGHIDDRFGNGNGFVYISHPEYQTIIRSIGLLSDGKLLIAGSVYATDRTLGYVARCHIDGTIDSTFGEKGFFLTTVGSIQKMNFSSSGKIAAVGSSSSLEVTEGLLMCLTHDGRLDPVFNGGAPVLTTLDNSITDIQFLNVAFDSDDKIVVHGNTQGGEEADTVLARFLPSGELDQTFGDGAGWVRTKLTDSVDAGNAMVIQVDGRIVIVGMASIDGSYPGMRQFAIRYLN